MSAAILSRPLAGRRTVRGGSLEPAVPLLIARHCPNTDAMAPATRGVFGASGPAGTVDLYPPLPSRSCLEDRRQFPHRQGDLSTLRRLA